MVTIIEFIFSDHCLFSTLPVIHKVRWENLQEVWSFLSKFNSNADQWKKDCLFINPVHPEARFQIRGHLSAQSLYRFIRPHTLGTKWALSGHSLALRVLVGRYQYE